jgi:hypothetical protein
LGPSLFLLYVNDNPSGMHSDSKLILYAGNTSTLITGKARHEVHNSVTTLKYISKWFSVNGLSLNMDKIKIIRFYFSHSQQASLQISYKGRHINDDTNIKFLGMQIDKQELKNTYWIDNSKIKRCVLCN